MIATSICVLGVGFLLLKFLYFHRFSQTMNVNNLQNACVKPHKRTLLMLITFLLFSTICSIPIIYAGGGVASIINLLYSYFDSPSILAVLMICVSCLRQCLKITNIYGYNLSLANIAARVKFNGYCALLLFVYGGILYAGSLFGGFFGIEFDLYHADILQQGVACFLLLILLYRCSPETAYLGLFALIFFYLSEGEKSLLENLICPYLWIYCALYLIYVSIRYLYNILTKR